MEDRLYTLNKLKNGVVFLLCSSLIVFKNHLMSFFIYLLTRLSYFLFVNEKRFGKKPLNCLNYEIHRIERKKVMQKKKLADRLKNCRLEHDFSFIVKEHESQ